MLVVAHHAGDLALKPCMFERMQKGAIGLPLRKAGDHPFGMLQRQRFEKARVLAVAEAHRQLAAAQRAHCLGVEVHTEHRQSCGGQLLQQA